MGIAGIPWWTTDIGGFHGGDIRTDAFKEVFIRWFQWGTFCPVMRLHGDRYPRMGGTETCDSGADNEVWSYGEKAYTICEKYLRLREMMRPYVRGLMQEAHEKGTPVMRPLFYHYPEDKEAWNIDEQYLFGESILVCPIVQAGQSRKQVYLPKGTWVEYETDKVWEGGQYIIVETPIEQIPFFVRQADMHIFEVVENET